MFAVSGTTYDESHGIISSPNRNNAETKSKTTSCYEYFRPIAILLLVIGNLPLKNLQSKRSEMLAFSFCSFPVAYTMFLLIFSIIITVSLMDWVSIYLTLSTRLDLKNEYILYVVFRSLFSCIFTMLHCRKLIKLVKVLDRFDHYVMETFKENSMDSRNYLKSTVLPLVLYIISAVVVNTELIHFFIASTGIVVTGTGKYVLIITCTVVGIWQVTPMFLYQYFVAVMYFNFKRLNAIFFKLVPVEKWYLESVSVDEFVTDMKDVVKDIRQLHLVMADSVKLFNRTYGHYVAFEYFYIRIAVGINLFVLFFAPSDVSIMLFGAIISAFVTLFLSHGVAIEVS
ncbi:hypothetical protein QE152_g40129 [Popillia japonica]|uniref:Gustatory receptor n=1 Tax=Popillia japonica TaxID=7064 RepID=A0AAW1HSR4_POPJA